MRDALADNDASHDFAHIERVRNVALHIAKAEVRHVASRVITARTDSSTVFRAWKIWKWLNWLRCCMTLVTGSACCVLWAAAFRSAHLTGVYGRYTGSDTAGADMATEFLRRQVRALRPTCAVRSFGSGLTPFATGLRRGQAEARDLHH
mgnify:CR=1 FL=1